MTEQEREQRFNLSCCPATEVGRRALLFPPRLQTRLKSCIDPKDDAQGPAYIHKCLRGEMWGGAESLENTATVGMTIKSVWVFLWSKRWTESSWKR